MWNSNGAAIIPRDSRDLSLKRVLIDFQKNFCYNNMASKNKKKKAKNSFLYNGADKLDCKMKRIMYFTKRQRIKNKKGVADDEEI